MNGVEYGADVYIDMIPDETLAIFMKEKTKMRAGKTDKSVSMKDDKLFKLIEQFVDKARFEGIIGIDIFKVDDKYFISEINLRFGGGYSHGYECGINILRMIIENINRNANENVIGKYNEVIYMMIYNEERIKK